MTARERLRRSLPVLAVVALMVVLAIATVAPREGGLPLDPRSTRPEGTAALLAVLRELGVGVDVASTDSLTGSGGIGGPSDVVLVLADPDAEAWTAALDDALSAGARVVVTDPGSELAPEAVQSFLPPAVAPDCDVTAFADIQRVTAGGAAYEVPATAVGCFPHDDDLAWLVLDEVDGGGILVATGGAGFLTNAAIDEADNALLAAALLTPRPGGTVTVVGPEIALLLAEGRETLIDLVPDRVRLALLQLLVALVVVVAWRWRRLGPPVEEPLPVELPASALVTATGELLDQAGAYDRAARTLSQALRTDLVRRTGLSAQADDARIARAAAPILGRPVDHLLQALDPGGTTGPDALVAHARRVARLRAAVSRAGSPTAVAAAVAAEGHHGHDRQAGSRPVGTRR